MVLLKHNYCIPVFVVMSMFYVLCRNHYPFLYVRPLYQKQGILAPFFLPYLFFVSLSLSPFHCNSFTLRVDHSVISLIIYFHYFTQEPPCQSSHPHPHLMTSPAEVYFATNANVVIFPMTAKVVEVMRNTSAAAPGFPNTGLKAADFMFLELILYLS